jgi:hypothetical protein
VARDGDDSLAYRAYLERWRTAEDRHFADEATEASADLTVDGATTGGADRHAGTTSTANRPSPAHAGTTAFHLIPPPHPVFMDSLTKPVRRRQRPRCNRMLQQSYSS